MAETATTTVATETTHTTPTPTTPTAQNGLAKTSSLQLDADTRHQVESMQMHIKLRSLGSNALVASKFIQNVLVYCSPGVAQFSALDTALATSCALMTTFNSPTAGPKSMGFDVDGELPFAMVVADLFEERVAFHSSSATLIREFCASFYGAVDGGGDQARVVRHEIDTMAKIAEANRCSLCLIICCPWGSAIRDRYWRVFTVRKNGGVYVDSERTLDSWSKPPCAEGNSVLGPSQNFQVHPDTVKKMRDTWQSRCIDAAATAAIPSIETTEDTTESAAEQKLRVCNAVIGSLRTRQREMQIELDDVRDRQDDIVMKSVSEQVEAASIAYHADVASLQSEVDTVADTAEVHRVEARVLASELRFVDTDAMKAVETELRDLKGKILVLEDEKRAATKSMADSRKRDLKASKERVRSEALNETLTTETARLKAALDEHTKRAADAKRGSSEQLLKLVEAKATLLGENTDLNKKLADAVEQLEDTEQRRRSTTDALVGSRRETKKCALDLQNALTKLNEHEAVTRAATRAAAEAAAEASAEAAAEAATRATAEAAAEATTQTDDQHHTLETTRVAALKAIWEKHRTRKFYKLSVVRCVSATFLTRRVRNAATQGEKLWNAVAAAKGAIRTLEHFVTSSQGGSAPALPRPTPRPPPPPTPTPFFYPNGPPPQTDTMLFFSGQ